MKQALRLLLVEDSQSDAAMIERILGQAGYDLTTLRVDTPDGLRAALRDQTWDLVISDFRLPLLNAHNALKIFKESGLDIPFIVVSGRIGEEVAAEMMRAGTHDYLLKNNLTRLGPAVTRELAEAANRRNAHRGKKLQDLMFNVSLDAMCLCDFQTKLEQVNAAWTTIFGWQPEELLEKSWFELIHPDDLASSKERFNAAVLGKSSVGFDNRIRCHDGSFRWISWDIVLVPDEKMIFANGRDVTEKREADSQLQMLGTCIAKLNDGVLVTEANLGTPEDPGPPIVFVNDAFLKLTGYERHEVIGRSPRFLHGAKTDKAELERVRKAMLTGEHVVSELISYKRNGQEFYNEFGIVPIYNDAGKMINLVAIQRDVTERRRMEEALRQSEEHYRIIAAFNQKLLHEVNHRVRTNLAALLSLITMSRKRASDLPSFADSIEGRIRSFAHVHNLMAISGGKPMQLRDVIANLSHVSRETAANAIEVQIDGPAILLDPAKILPLAYALVELFNNSIRYGVYSSPDGILQINWTFARTSTDSRITLHWVETDGPPIVNPVVPKLGFKLIEGFVKHDLNGKFVARFQPQGADHEIEFSVPTITGSTRET